VGGTVREHGLHPAIDKTYPLIEAPEALAYLGEGHAKAKIMIAV
jgi:NADPH:quinone reductase-like Zn-dependent oxidoreductase